MNSTVMICTGPSRGDRREIVKAEIARTPIARAVGLLGRTSLPPHCGVLLCGCRAIHTAFMMFWIDAVFLDEDFTIVGVRSRLKPFRVAVGPVGTRHTLELPSGTAKEIPLEPGCRLSLLRTQG